MTQTANQFDERGHRVTLPGTWTRDLPAPDGSMRRIMVGMPDAEAPPEGFPALYLLDADTSFAGMVETMRRCARRPDATGIQPTAIIGIARPEGAAYRREARIADLTPGPALRDVAEEHGGLGGGDQHDGAGAFLRFIEESVKPFVSARHALDPGRTALFGHSLAGYFVLDTMIRRPDSFSTYVAISPSIWWDEARLRNGIEDAARTSPRVLIGAGGWEDALPPWQAEDDALAERRAARRMVARARDYAAALASAFGPERARFELFENEDHASVLNVAMVRALRFLGGH